MGDLPNLLTEVMMESEARANATSDTRKGRWADTAPI
jgi:hypothetical protein